MIKKKFVAIAIALGLCFAGTAATLAQDKSDPEKIVLLKKLFALMNLKPLQDTILGSSLGQIEEQLFTRLENVAMQGTSLTDEQRAALKRHLAEYSKRVSAKFMEQFQQKVNFPELTEKIMIPLYEKQFSTNEIKDMIAFYKSPTGQKMVKVLPQITQEALQKSMEALVPQAMQVMGEVMETEKDAFAKLLQDVGIDSTPPSLSQPRKTTKTKKR